MLTISPFSRYGGQKFFQPAQLPYILAYCADDRDIFYFYYHWFVAAGEVSFFIKDTVVRQQSLTVNFCDFSFIENCKGIEAGIVGCLGKAGHYGYIRTILCKLLYGLFIFFEKMFFKQ